MSAEYYHADFYDPPEDWDPDLPSDNPHSPWNDDERLRNEMAKKRTTKKRAPVKKLRSTFLTKNSKALQKAIDDAAEKLLEELKMELKFIETTGLTPDEPPFAWTTQTGKKMHPSQMAEEHLRNAISYTQRKLRNAIDNAVYLDNIAWLARAFYEFLKEAKRRGIRV